MEKRLITLFPNLAYIGLRGGFSWQVLAERFLAFTHNGWWFVVSYLGLMLLSPLLNKAVEAMTKQQLFHSILFFTIVMLYLGWYHKVEATNYGNSLISFLWLYLIGRYIGTHISRCAGIDDTGFKDFKTDIGNKVANSSGVEFINGLK